MTGVIGLGNATGVTDTIIRLPLISRIGGGIANGNDINDINSCNMNTGKDNSNNNGNNGSKEIHGKTTMLLVQQAIPIILVHLVLIQIQIQLQAQIERILITMMIIQAHNMVTMKVIIIITTNFSYNAMCKVCLEIFFNLVILLILLSLEYVMLGVVGAVDDSAKQVGAIFVVTQVIHNYNFFVVKPSSKNHMTFFCSVWMIPNVFCFCFCVVLFSR